MPWLTLRFEFLGSESSPEPRPLAAQNAGSEHCPQGNAEPANVLGGFLDDDHGLFGAAAAPTIEEAACKWIVTRRRRVAAAAAPVALAVLEEKIKIDFDKIKISSLGETAKLSTTDIMLLECLFED